MRFGKQRLHRFRDRRDDPVPTQRTTSSASSALATYYVEPDFVRQMGWYGKVSTWCTCLIAALPQHWMTCSADRSRWPSHPRRSITSERGSCARLNYHRDAPGNLTGISNCGRVRTGLRGEPLALTDPRIRARFAELGSTAMPGSPADFGKLIAD